jgi:hypothetical protein
MKIQKTAVVELVVSTDKTRPVLAAPYLEVQDGAGTMIATNGRSMAVIPVEIDPHDVSGWVSIPALVADRKLARKSEPVEIVCNGSCALSDGSTFPRPLATPANAPEDYIHSRFPNWRQVVPDATKEPKLSILLDPSLLMELAKALGASEGVRLEFSENPLDPVKITGVKGQPGFGLLMLMRTA